MNRDNSFAKRPEENTQKVEKESKTFKDISKYFSEEEWKKLGYSEKISLVYMKRNYDTMTKLGLSPTIPDFMCPNKLAIQLQEGNSVGEGTSGNQDEPPQVTSKVQKTKKLKMMSQKPSKEESPSEEAPGAVLSKKPTDAGQPQAQLCPTGKASTSGQQRTQAEGPKKMIHIWTHRLRERKTVVVYEEISDPEKDD